MNTRHNLELAFALLFITIATLGLAYLAILVLIYR